MQGGHPDNSEAGSQRLAPAGIVPEFHCQGFGRYLTKAGADLDTAVSARRLFRRLWLGLRRQLRQGSALKAGANRRGRPQESGSPPLFALSLQIERNIAHG